jgi:hypothetical protein
LTPPARVSARAAGWCPRDRATTCKQSPRVEALHGLLRLGCWCRCSATRRRPPLTAPQRYRQASTPRKPPGASFAARDSRTQARLYVCTFKRSSSRHPPKEQLANASRVRLNIGRQ